MFETKCPECGSKNIEQSYLGECVCKVCGLIIEDNLPDATIYREGTSRTKPQPMNSKIVKSVWLLSSKEKNLERARNKITILAERLNLPKFVKEEAYRIYELAVNKDLCVGRDGESILHACIYAACSQNNIPKTITEITEYSLVTKRKLIRAYSLLQKNLGMKAKVHDVSDFLPRFTSNLGLSHDCLTKTMRLMDKIKGTALYSGKNPKSIAAAVIYIAANMNKERLSQRAVANEIGVMEVTIRKRYKEITKSLGISF